MQLADQQRRQHMRAARLERGQRNRMRCLVVRMLAWTLVVVGRKSLLLCLAQRCVGTAAKKDTGDNAIRAGQQGDLGQSRNYLCARAKERHCCIDQRSARYTGERRKFLAHCSGSSLCGERQQRRALACMGGRAQERSCAKWQGWSIKGCNSAMLAARNAADRMAAAIHHMLSSLFRKR